MRDDWLSIPARDLFQVAIMLAGFAARELVLEITRLQGGCSRKANINTVEQAMQNIMDRTGESNASKIRYDRSEK